MGKTVKKLLKASLTLKSRCSRSRVFAGIFLPFFAYFAHQITYENLLLHSNMSNFVPEKVFLRGVLLHYFNVKKTAAESHRILVEVYGEHALVERTWQKWFTRYKCGDFGLEDEERAGQPKSLKMKNWKHYSIKIVVKHNKSWQNLWKSLKQPFQNV